MFNTKKTNLAHMWNLLRKAAALFPGNRRKPAFPESSGRKSPYMLVEVEAQYLYEDFLYELENGLLCLFVFDKAE